MIQGMTILDAVLSLPLLILLFTSMVPLAWKILRGGREPNLTLSTLLVLFGLGAAGSFTWAVSEVSVYGFLDAVVFDSWSFVATYAVLFVTAVAVILSRENVQVQKSQFSENLFLLLNSSIGMLVMCYANNLLVIFLGMELMSLCLYILIAMSLDEHLSKEASFKYFILGSVAAAFFIFGSSFIYGASGSLSLSHLSEVGVELVDINRQALVGLIFIIAALGFKVALFPFQFWLPDVYEGAPSSLTAFMGAGVKIAAFTALVRLVSTDFFFSIKAQNFLLGLEVLAVLTMISGAIAALFQENLKRLIAYSGVSHAGFAFVGLVLATKGDGLVAASVLFYYLLSYVIMVIGAFSVVSILENQTQGSLRVSDLKGLSRTNPKVALLFSIILLSLAGIPPLFGFFAKLFVFSILVAEQAWWILAWSLAAAAIGIYYYLKPLALMYMHTSEESEQLELLGLEKKLGSFVVLSLSAAALVVCGILTTPIFNFIASNLESLF